MMKHKKLILSLLVLVLLVAAMHFIPVYSKRGYLDEGTANVCPDYIGTIPDSYRVVTNGIHNFQQDKKHLVATNSGCDKPVTLRLYLF